MKRLDALEKIDSDFLRSIAELASVDIDVLHNILYLSHSDYVEWPMDDTEYEDINEGYDEKYEWVNGRPLRISGYGRDVDLQMCSLDQFANEVRDGRLIDLTIDFSNRNVENPARLFKALNSALKLYAGELVLESLCLCSLENNPENFCNLRSNPSVIELSELEIRLPYLKHLILNRVKFSSINFIASPRLKSISIFESGIEAYDFSRLINIEDICVGDSGLDKIILPLHNGVKKVIVAKGILPTVREREAGIGSSLSELISNIGFSLESLSIVACGVSKIDLSVFSNLKYLNLKDNPIAELNLAWVPNLESLNLEGTGIHSMNASKLKKFKSS